MIILILIGKISTFKLLSHPPTSLLLVPSNSSDLKHKLKQTQENNNFFLLFLFLNVEKKKIKIKVLTTPLSLAFSIAFSECNKPLNP